jgi:hypothetical protein
VQQTAPWVAPDLARAVHAAVLRVADARWPDLGELELGLTMAAGFAMANAPLYKASLTGVSQITRQEAAAKAELPAHWQDLLRR